MGHWQTPILKALTEEVEPEEERPKQVGRKSARLLEAEGSVTVKGALEP